MYLFLLPPVGRLLCSICRIIICGQRFRLSGSEAVDLCARFPMSLLGLTVRMSLPIPSPPCNQWLQRLPRQQRVSYVARTQQRELSFFLPCLRHSPGQLSLHSSAHSIVSPILQPSRTYLRQYPELKWNFERHTFANMCIEACSDGARERGKRSCDVGCGFCDR